ncbi:MAG: transcriptional regulator NrdR [Planctomycetota bacterium]|nr:transcriptional regulator NrdR [Planctomycetota bacterium]
MRCPHCRDENDKVVDTRSAEDGSVIRRRRECVKCGKRFTTHERLEDMPVKVVKKSGQIEDFSRDKILAGVCRATEKRPVQLDDLRDLVSGLERQITAGNRREINSRDIGEMVMRELRRLDEVAYVRFASVYREYQAVDEFIKEVSELHEPGHPDSDGFSG